ncbi:MAG: thioredoxin [Oscillospiraceae bacterium]|nr:thioredoxin [Oscillospiraceae bacterium]
MALQEITVANFEQEVLKADKPVLVDFNADWCGPCQMLKPTLHELADASDAYKIVSVNVDDESELAEEYDVFSIPCLVLFKDGKEAGRKVGAQPRPVLEAFLKG